MPAKKPSEAALQRARSIANKRAAIAAGRNKYEGKPCRLGHTTRYVGSSTCSACCMAHANIAIAARRAKNPPKKADHIFLGNPCKRGHAGLRYTVTYHCVECMRMASTQRYRAKLAAEGRTFVRPKAVKEYVPVDPSPYRRLTSDAT